LELEIWNFRRVALNPKQMKMKKLKKDQKGFTLVELLIVIAITGLITGGITLTIFQVFDINTRSTNRMAAISQLQNAGLWVSQDAQMAQNVDPEDDPDTLELELLTLTWTDWEGGDSHVVNYTLEAMPSGEFKILQREHYRNLALNSTTIVAEYINPDPQKTKCEFVGGELIFTVTATVGGESETRVYEVTPRPGS